MNQSAPRFEMPLQELFEGFAQDAVDAQVQVKDMKLDSRQVNPGDLFVALRGTEVDGVRFIDRAVERGAVAVALGCQSGECGE